VVSVEIGAGRGRANNNPGNLEFLEQRGARLGEDGRFAAFRSPEDGLAALDHQVRLYQSGRTRTGLGPQSSVRELAATYLGGAENPENDFDQYLSNLVFALRDWNVTENTKISKIPTAALVDAIAWIESNAIVSRETSRTRVS
ncbi:MAG: hypothetical protein ACE5FA_07875, partial [Dehalococcoidia bacterium]